MRYFLLVLFVLSLGVMNSCFKESRVNATTTVVKGSNGASVFPIERIFELDGCYVYRFYDEDKANYLSTCPKVSCTAPVCPTPTPTPEPKGHNRKLQDVEDGPQ